VVDAGWMWEVVPDDEVAEGRPIRLHLGCGQTRLEGFINIDLVGSEADRLMDATRLEFADGSIDEIYSSHLVEHFAYGKFLKALANWHRVLRPGGLLTIRCPNIERVLKNWLNADYEKRFGKGNLGVSAILGHQDRGLRNIHRNVFTPRRLREIVSGAGFEVTECGAVMNRYGDGPEGDILLRAVRGEGK